MAPTSTLLEPSFAALLAALEQAADLPVQTRRHWVCSVRQVAKWLDRPPVEIPARWNAVRLSVGHLHHARVGVTAKTFANHKSNLRAALRWFGSEHNVPQMGARLTSEWARFRDRLDRPIRDRLYNFIRYCSARGINPSSVNDAIFQDYWTYRTEFTGMASGNATRRPT
ncbi:MAG: site-specific integrase, partial [Pseudolabrys sp.]